MYVLWAITCGSAFFVGVMILTLTFGHAFMIMTNYTTLDSVKTKKCCPIPFCEFRNQQLSMDSVRLL